MKKKTMSSSELAQAIATVASDKKAENIVMLEIGKLSSISDYFVVCSGTSDRQVRSIADSIRKELRDKGEKTISIEGEDKGHWVLLDYGNVVVHVFHEEDRAFYQIESLWSDAEKTIFEEKKSVG